MTQLLRRKAINTMSPRRKRESRVYLKLRKAFLAEHPICQMRVQCQGGRSSEVHHSRGRLGPNYLDVTGFIAACFYCHAWVHAHGRQAREAGLLA